MKFIYTNIHIYIIHVLHICYVYIHIQTVIPALNIQCYICMFFCVCMYVCMQLAYVYMNRTRGYFSSGTSPCAYFSFVSCCLFILSRYMFPPSSHYFAYLYIYLCRLSFLPLYCFFSFFLFFFFCTKRPGVHGYACVRFGFQALPCIIHCYKSKTFSITFLGLALQHVYLYYTPPRLPYYAFSSRFGSECVSASVRPSCDLFTHMCNTHVHHDNI